MSLRQKTFFFVALSVAALIAVYALFSHYYVQQRERQLADERNSAAAAIAEDFSGFFKRGIDRLQTVAALPGLVYGLQTLEESREGLQIPAWTTLHYLFYQSDIFSDVYLLNGTGKVLWCEPPNQDLIETVFPTYEEIAQKLRNPSEDFAFVVAGGSTTSSIHVASALRDGEGQIVGILVGAVPLSHPAIESMLRRNERAHGVVQLVDDKNRVIASTVQARQLRPYEYPPTGVAVLASAKVEPAGWTIISDENADEALADVRDLEVFLTVFGVVLTSIAMASLLFILRSFTRPVEELTEAARRIGDGDLTGGFTLNRNDEIGVLAKTLDSMNAKLKASYDLLLQSEKSSLMGQVIAGIAHELNNPLTIVIGNIQLMMTRELNERNVELLARVKDGADRASKIVKNLLTFARQEKPERIPTDINAVLRKTIELRAYELKVSNIEVSCNFALGLPQTLADPHHLQRVFLNLIVNAEQAMIDANGRGLLRMTTRTEGDKILVFFSDDGPGIPNENLHRIFEPFFTTKAVGKGTGLGLSICQGIIVEHGGRIDVVSTPGRGATLIVELPIQTCIPEPVCDASPARPASVSRKRILVVEDEVQIRQLFEDIFREQGHDVQAVSNGRLALDLLDHLTYDLIISDVKMPEIGGPAFYSELKRKGTGLEQRVIFVTGDLMNQDTLHFIENTGCPWIGKPFDIDAITRTVAECLSVGTSKESFTAG